MTTTWFFNKERILSRVREGLEEALEQAAERVAADARQRAPIRKVFKEKKGFRFKTRALTAQEQSVSTRLRNDYYGSRGMAAPQVPARLNRVQLPSRASANTLAKTREKRQLGQISRGRFTSSSGATRTFSHRTGQYSYEPGPSLKSQLTRRGLGEIRSGSAVHVYETAKGTRVQAGGALKASITSTPVHQTASGMEAQVVATAPYAKYVEFPTIHNRAQPFLLPALKDEQRTFVSDVASVIRSKLGG